MNRVFVGIVVVAVLVGVGSMLLGCTPSLPGASSATEPVVEQVPIVRNSGDTVAEAVVVPVRDAQLGLAIGGIVAEVLVAEGDQVEAGQVMVRLDPARQEAAVAQAEAQVMRAQNAVAEIKAGARPEEIDSAQAAVALAQAQLARVEEGARPEEVAAAEAALSAAHATLQKVQDGPRPEEIEAAEAALAAARATLDKVREGPREGELVAARADVANAEAALRQAQSDYDRVKNQPHVSALPESLQLEQATNSYNAAVSRLEALQEGATVADIDAARAGVEQARAQLDAIKAEARSADIASAQAGIDQAQAQLDAIRAPARTADMSAAQAEIQRAQAQLELIEAGARPETIAALEADLASAEAALRQSQVALADTVLEAPFAGTVASLDTSVGEQVMPGAPVVWLADLSEWQIETDDLTELSVVNVEVGAPAVITFDAITSLDLPGKVVRIGSIAESKMGDTTYTVIVAPDAHDDRLRWGMTAMVEIETD
ncbi:biotin/lipoyl-binding protein [Chloroflexota bacterium]